MKTAVFRIFKECVQAIREARLIIAESPRDKEFHFQNWFERCLQESCFDYDQLGRNKYPDFVLAKWPEGYEVKGLEWPGRIDTFDANSQVPKGFHNGRDIFYVFGRYPKRERGEKEYPVIDLVICHGDFLNADREYEHKNKHVRGFGTYGDIMIRDRKMYVVPTPFVLVEGTTGTHTLIVPEDLAVEIAAPEIAEKFQQVGTLVRREADYVLVRYTFDLRTNEIKAEKIPNPNADAEHRFVAYRCEGEAAVPVSMVPFALRKVGDGKEDG